jgi:hypothetical protein
LVAAPLLWDLCGESTVRPAAWVTTQRERIVTALLAARHADTDKLIGFAA